MSKERSLILRDWESRAIIDGQKTMLRRAVNIAKHPCVDWGYAKNHVGLVVGLCPFGQPGDRLWIKESWRRNTPDMPDGITYRAGTATGLSLARWFDGTETVEAREQIVALPRDGKWRPSINMPLWASRILLEIVAVWVERLQDINEADAVAEGVPPGMTGHEPWFTGSPQNMDKWCKRSVQIAGRRGLPRPPVATLLGSYSLYWDHLNGAGNWDKNPWIWVVEFRRVDA